MSEVPPPPPEFSRIVDLRGIEDRPLVLAATPEEGAALARRFDLVAVNRLEATLTLVRDKGTVSVNGRLRAAIVQSCAVSAEDLPVGIDVPLAFRFVPAVTSHRPDEEIELSEEDCDEIEYSDGRFDLGEAVAQSLLLAIDPFAKGPQAEQTRIAAGLADEGASGPFAALAALKDKNPAR